MWAEEKLKSKMYQVGLNGGADPQLVPFLLDFLDEVNEHVCLKQVLQEKNRVLQLTPSFFLLIHKEFFYDSVTKTGNCHGQFAWRPGY